MRAETARGFEPYSHLFSPRSRRYYFKPNLKLLVALLPHLYNDGPPIRVICPMAGVGAAPLLTLAFYREETRVVVWEEDDFWRQVCEENLRNNSFCQGRYELLPPHLWGMGDGAVITTAPKPRYSDVGRWYSRLEKNMQAVARSMHSGTIIVVSKRVDQGYHEYIHTENLILKALLDAFGKRITIVEVGEVEDKHEIERPVFIVAKV